jgi:GDP-L-fucose synthase
LRILVTGGSGFLGHHLKRAFREVYSPSREELNLLNGVDEIANYIRRNKIEVVIHAAGDVGGIGYNQNNQGCLMYRNLQMGMNVLEAARLQNVSKVIMLGTVCSYPHSPKTIPFIEDEIFDGMPEITNSGYGIAKRSLIKLGIEYSSQYNMDIVNLVPVNMMGTFDHFDTKYSHVIPAIIRKFEDATISDSFGPGEPALSHSTEAVLWGTGESSREFLWVEDCVAAIRLAIKKHKVGPQPINLGTGREIKIKDLAELIHKIGGYDCYIHWDKGKPDGQPRRCLNVDKAKAILGWEAKTSLEDGISEIIKWYRHVNS